MRPAMSNDVDRHARVAVTSRYVELDGKPFIPVSGEFHFSRVPRREWERRLRLMRSGGVNVVAAYVIWIHHQPSRDEPVFDGNRDVGAFVDLCAELGLHVVLRIGPWCHGEVRNGGFPDWVQHAPVQHRSDDPAYLALVKPWWAALGNELTGKLGPGSPVIGIQIENELYDQPGHILTLKEMARASAITAPLWLATAWGGAKLPEAEVLPMFGGYADGFWVDPGEPWDDTFREHFFFSHIWDDPGIGADIRAMVGTPLEPDHRSPSVLFPPVTCELGGGMATAYHRRPRLSGDHIAAVANNKLGNGSAWQGYYMYAGGMNPAADLQESHETGYPNDLPHFDYDFHAPVSASGQTGPAHGPLRLQHAFLATAGERLALMPSTLPDILPGGVEDSHTLRWAVRTDGKSGFVFITMCQPHVPLQDVAGVQFHIEGSDSPLVFPREPVTIPAGTIARWPFGFETAGPVLRWATASLVTVLEDPGLPQTVVLAAEQGIPVELAFPENTAVKTASAVQHLSPGIMRVAGDERTVLVAGGVRFVVLPRSDAERTWVLDPGGRRKLLLSDQELLVDGGDVLVTTYGEPAKVELFDGERGAFADMPVPGHGQSASCEIRVLREAQVPWPGYGQREGRPSAPSFRDIDERAARYSVELPAWTNREDVECVLEIDWTGDVAVLSADGVKVADRFGDGSRWRINLRDVAAPGARLEVQVLPMAPDSSVWLDDQARSSLPGAAPSLQARVHRRLASRVALPAYALVEAR